MAGLDLLILLDPRLHGAEARSLSLAIRTVAARGYDVGLCPIRSPLPSTGRPFNPLIWQLIDSGLMSLVDSDRRIDAGLLLAWHIAPLLGRLDRPIAVDAGHAILRFDQAPWRADGIDRDALQRIRTNFADMIGGRSFEEVSVDPATAHLVGCSGEVWLPPVLIPDPVGSLRSGRSEVIGRHGGVGNAAWPADEDAFDRAYPASRQVRVDLLGPPIQIIQHRLRRPSPYLRLLPDNARDLRSFMATLDVWQMAGWAGIPQPVSAEVVEAAAHGVPLLLPKELRGWPEEAANWHAGEFRDVGDDRDVVRCKAQDHVREAAHPAALVDRLEQKGMRRAAPIGTLIRRNGRTRRTVLMVSPNGIGMGHLTRLLAVARRLHGSVEPIFLTMSQAVEVVERYGFHAEYVPYHSYYGGDADYWNKGLLARLLAMVGFYDPKVILFDGNMPYAALADLRRICPDRRFLWLRRGLWRPEAGKVALERTAIFDMVIEPGEYAAAADRGLTRTRASTAVVVPPVTLLDDGDILDREQARIELAIAPEATAVVVLLGSQNNFDYGLIRRCISKHLGNKPNVILVEAEWMISNKETIAPLSGGQRLAGFPLARLFKAFDFAISAAGYNSFHELLSMGIPTVFVPNEHPSMDEQEARASWAEREGLGVAVRAHEPDRLVWAIEQCQRREIAVRMRENAKKLQPPTGGLEVARLIMEQLTSRDVAREPWPELPHFSPRSAPLLA